MTCELIKIGNEIEGRTKAKHRAQQNSTPMFTQSDLAANMQADTGTPASRASHLQAS